MEMNECQSTMETSTNSDWIRPDKPSRCTYDGKKKFKDSPHIHKSRSYYSTPKLLPNVLHLTYNTPLIRINKITKEEDIKCEILAKCDFFSAGGSVKDRIAVKMVEDAEEKKLIKLGDVLIEPTSGNTGIGLALVSAVKGYKCIVTIPEKMSREKIRILKALGAEIVQTPTIAAYDHYDSNIRKAYRLCKQIPNAYILDQYRNASNPLAHYDSTAEEIFEACDGQIDMIVCGAGTGGTITGIARKIKERLPHCKIIGVDPVGSVLASPRELNTSDTSFYEVEGIGDDFIPTTIDKKCIDKWYKCTDMDSFRMARRLIRQEGLLCGGSSGSAMSCAIRAARDFRLTEGQRIVVILPDSIRNYMTKFLNDDWLKARSLLDDNPNSDYNQTWWRKREVKVLQSHPIKKISSDSKLLDALKALNNIKADIIAVLSPNGSDVVGTISSRQVMRSMISGKGDAPITDVMNRQFRQIAMNDNLANLFNLLEYAPHVLVSRSDNKDNKLPKGYLTKLDLASYICQNSPLL